jgi:hypothetical protein
MEINKMKLTFYFRYLNGARRYLMAKKLIFIGVIVLSSCVKKSQGVSDPKTSQATVQEIKSKLIFFWNNVRNVGNSAEGGSLQTFPIDIPSHGDATKEGHKATFTLKKTAPGDSTWSVSFDIDRDQGRYRNVTIYLKKSPQGNGPDLYAEWGNRDEITQIWFESVMKDRGFITSVAFSPLYAILKEAAWVSLDKDLREYLDALKLLGPQEVALFPKEQDENKKSLVTILDFSGKGLRWQASEAEWYRRPRLEWRGFFCGLVITETLSIDLVPLSKNPQLTRGKGPWRLDIWDNFYLFVLPFQREKHGSFYLENGDCSLYSGVRETRYQRGSPGYPRCIEKIMRMIIESEARSKGTVGNDDRVLDYINRATSSL